MANTKSAKKAIRVSERKAAINKNRRSRIRTFIRKVEDAIKNKSKTDARTALKNLESELMKGVNKNIFKLNTASRKLSRLSTKVKNVEERKKSTEADHKKK